MLIMYSAVAFYANLKWCDIKKKIKSRFMRKVSNNANPSTIPVRELVLNYARSLPPSRINCDRAVFH
jgi:hypothetical protein